MKTEPEYISMTDLAAELATDRNRVTTAVDVLDMPTYRIGKCKCIKRDAIPKVRHALRLKPERMPERMAV